MADWKSIRIEGARRLADRLPEGWRISQNPFVQAEGQNPRKSIVVMVGGEAQSDGQRVMGRGEPPTEVTLQFRFASDDQDEVSDIVDILKEAVSYDAYKYDGAEVTPLESAVLSVLVSFQVLNS